MEQMHNMMTLKEISEYLKIGHSTPYRWVNSGILPAIKLPSGMVRVRRSDFEKFIQEFAIQAPDSPQPE